MWRRKGINIYFEDDSVLQIGFSNRHEKHIEILNDNPYATYIEIADQLKVSRKTVAQKIKLLKDKGIIIRIGSAKKGYWKRL